MPKKLTLEEFLVKARAVHGERYDYSQTVYLPTPQKIAIRCPLHGVFMQQAGMHLAGKGCQICGDIVQRAKVSALGKSSQKWTTESFRARCQELYPDLDFSTSVYSYDQCARISYSCSVHGNMEQAPFYLLSGRGGCRLCRLEARKQARENKPSWLAKFYAMHGDYYDYTLLPTGIVGDDKLQIICIIHGQFTQSAFNHAAGAGCRKCHDAKTSERSSLGREGYIEKFRAVHGERYGYDLVHEKFKAKDKVAIICEAHGIFQQAAFEHSTGAGCPKCSLLNRKGDQSPGWRRSHWVKAAAGRPGYLYVVRLYDEHEEFYKVGITYRSVKERFKSGMPYKYEEIALVRIADAGLVYDLEKRAKSTLRNIKYTPMREFAGQHECFSHLQPILAVLPASM